MKDGEYKKQLHNQILLKLDQSILELKKMLNSLSADKKSETKSVVGDKFETARSMMQREEDQLKTRIINLQTQRTQLVHNHQDDTCQTVEAGTVVWTSSGIYHISIPFGKLMFMTSKIFCMSSQAPIAKMLLGKKTGDKFQFNNKEVEILKVC